MTYWYIGETGGIHYTDQVPLDAESWGRNDERGVYHYRTEELAQADVDKHPGWNMKREGKTVRL